MNEPAPGQPGWDMHDYGPELVRPPDAQLPPGARTTGTVVCHHPFGLGVHLDDHDEYGHVNITEITTGTIRGPQDLPPIGTRVTVTVLGYTGRYSQMRLTLKRANAG